MEESDFNAEILQFAIAKEVEAHYFYQALARRVNNPKMQTTLENLAKEELEHKAKLELEVMKAGKTIKDEQIPARPDEEYIISDDLLPLDMDYKDMLMLGIEKEEAAFRIYVNLAASIHNESSREVLLTLAEEEVKHKLRFEAEYDILLRKKTS